MREAPGGGGEDGAGDQARTSDRRRASCDDETRCDDVGARACAANDGDGREASLARRPRSRIDTRALRHPFRFPPKRNRNRRDSSGRDARAHHHAPPRDPLAVRVFGGVRRRHRARGDVPSSVPEPLRGDQADAQRPPASIGSRGPARVRGPRRAGASGRRVARRDAVDATPTSANPRDAPRFSTRGCERGPEPLRRGARTHARRDVGRRWRSPGSPLGPAARAPRAGRGHPRERVRRLGRRLRPHRPRHRRRPPLHRRTQRQRRRRRPRVAPVRDAGQLGRGGDVAAFALVAPDRARATRVRSSKSRADDTTPPPSPRAAACKPSA